MPLIPYDPFQMFRRDFSILPSFSHFLTEPDWMNANPTGMPRVEVRENENTVIVTAELPKYRLVIKASDTEPYMSLAFSFLDLATKFNTGVCNCGTICSYCWSFVY